MKLYQILHEVFEAILNSIQELLIKVLQDCSVAGGSLKVFLKACPKFAQNMLNACLNLSNTFLESGLKLAKSLFEDGSNQK